MQSQTADAKVSARPTGVYCILSRAQINALVRASQQSRKNGWKYGYVNVSFQLCTPDLDIRTDAQLDTDTLTAEAW